MKTPVILLAGLFLAGCALDLEASAWQRPGALAQQVTAAELECARRTYTMGPGPDLVLGGLLDVGRLALQESRQANAFSGCMTAQGYARARR